MKTELEYFRPVLEAGLDSVELRHGFTRHIQLCVPAGGLQVPFEMHAPSFSKNRAQSGRGRGVEAAPMQEILCQQKLFQLSEALFKKPKGALDRGGSRHINSGCS